MPFQRLPESVQTLYAELLEQTIHAEAEAAVLGAPQGSFVSKTSSSVEDGWRCDSQAAGRGA